MRSFLLTAGLITAHLVGGTAYAQEKNTLGFTIQLERSPEVYQVIPPGAPKTTRSGFEPGVGISYERLMTKHSGISVELRFRQSINEVQIPVSQSGNSTEYIPFTIAEKLLSLPVLYSYHSRLLNVSAGPTLDYFIGWKQRATDYYMPLGSYKPFMEKEISLGLLVGISKAIPAGTKLVIEPGLYYNRVLSFERSYYGASLATKYRF